MPIARKGRFLLTDDLLKGTTMVLESSQLRECIDEARLRGYTGAAGTPNLGFHESTLDALIELPHLRHVWFWEVQLSCINGLYSLKQLESFGVHPRRPPIAFERLPSLRKMVWTYKARDTGVESLSLDLLHLWRYAPKSRHFAGLELPTTLRELQLLWCNPSSLEGFTPIPGLKRLEIHQCRHMASLEALPALFPNLEHLVVTACGRVRAEEGEKIVGRLPKLNHMYVQSRLIV